MIRDVLRPNDATPPREVLDVRSATRLLLGLLAGLGVLTAAVAARWRPLMDLDHTVADRAFHRTAGHPWLTAWWTGLGHATEPIILRVLMAVVGVYLLVRGSRFLGGWLVAVAVVEQLVGPYSKYLLNRPRPHWSHPLEVLDTTSFPAGHATGIACFGTAVVLLAVSTLRTERARRWAMAGAALLVVLVCADRLLLGLHYTSDVAAGLLLGVATTVGCWLAALLLEARIRPGTARSSADRHRPPART